MDDLVSQILLKLNKPRTFVVKSKRGNTPEILLEDFVCSVIYDKVTSKTAKLYLNISEQTFNRLVKRLFPTVVLQGGGDTWYFYLLSLIEYKWCNYCNLIKPMNDMASGKSICKTCSHEYNTSDSRRILNREAQLRFYYNNTDYFLEKSARYRATKLQACPAWVSIEELQKIYDKRPKGYHVDHIVPLQGENVGGLHVPWNLQYLLPQDNLKKGNKYKTNDSW